MYGPGDVKSPRQASPPRHSSSPGLHNKGKSPRGERVDDGIFRNLKSHRRQSHTLSNNFWDYDYVPTKSNKMCSCSNLFDNLGLLNANANANAVTNSPLAQFLSWFGLTPQFNANAANTSASQLSSAELQPLVSNYKNALETGTAVTINNVNDFVNAEFTQMGAAGDNVTQNQFIQYLTALGYDNAEAKAITDAMDVDNNDKSITKAEAAAFYKTAMGNTNTLSAEKIQSALLASADKGDSNLHSTSFEKALAAKGYYPDDKNGCYTNGTEKILYTDYERLAQIIDS